MRRWSVADLMGRPAECRECRQPFTTQVIRGHTTVRCDPCRERPRKPCVCRWCREPFKPKRSDRRAFCSRDCSFAEQTAMAQAAHAAIPRATKPAAPPAVSCKVHFTNCERCGSLTSSPRRNTRFCSIACTKAAAKDRLIAERTAPRPCKACGESFSPEYGCKRRLFCSSACNKDFGRRATRSARRVRIGASLVAVDPFAVFERDGWCCRACGVVTPKALRGTFEPDAPELDHVLPLARGGGHTYKNTQLLCRACNRLKSDKHPSQFVCSAVPVSPTSGHSF